MTKHQRTRWARARRLGPLWYSLLAGGLMYGVGSAVIWAGALALFEWMIEPLPPLMWHIAIGFFLAAGVPYGVCNWFENESAYLAAEKPITSDPS